MRVADSIIALHLSQLWKAKFFKLCGLIFLGRLLGKFEIHPSWEWKEFSEGLRSSVPGVSRIVECNVHGVIQIFNKLLAITIYWKLVLYSSKTQGRSFNIGERDSNTWRKVSRKIVYKKDQLVSSIKTILEKFSVGRRELTNLLVFG